MMSYAVNLIQGFYTVPELVWEIYLILKNQGILIRPDDSLIQDGETEVKKNIWLNHSYTVRTKEAYRGYFTISEKENEETEPVDKYLLYIGDSSMVEMTDEDCLKVSSSSGAPGTPGVRRGSYNISSSELEEIFSNNPTTYRGSSGVPHCPLVVITDLEKQIIAHFPLGSNNNANTKCYKDEGAYAYDYLTKPGDYKHLYNLALKTVTNDCVKIIELSEATRPQTIPGHVVLGYIKGIGFNWITNFTTSTPYRHIGYQDTNDSNLQKFLSFEPNPLQVYFHHGMKYSYSGSNGIEYGEKKFFTRGTNGTPEFGFFKELSGMLLDCSSITPNGTRITIGNNTYYVIENTLITIGE